MWHASDWYARGGCGSFFPPPAGGGSGGPPPADFEILHAQRCTLVHFLDQNTYIYIFQGCCKL